jgi:two-component system chemotaxis sensor kinase CheA
VASLAKRSQLAQSGDRDRDGGAPAQRVAAGPVDRLLIAGVGQRRVAIPLDMVTRLEEFPAERIERVGAREVVQYREQILPVLRLSNLLGGWSDGAEDTGTVPVVVYTEGDRSVALAVEKILDIVEDTLDASRRDFGDDGLLGSAVIQQRVTELLDVRRAILAADPRFNETEEAYGEYDNSGYQNAEYQGYEDYQGQQMAGV